jgi:hypothetical protein
VFGNNWGVDRVIDTDGADTLNFSTVTSDLTVDFRNFSAASGANQVQWGA